MPEIIPGGPFSLQLDVLNSSGVRTAPGSGPTITIRKNGSTNTEMTLTQSNPSTGLYLYSGTVPAGWSHGDQIIVDADTGSTGVGAIGQFMVVSVPTVAQIWANATRSLDATSQAALVAAVWAAATRTLSAGVTFDATSQAALVTAIAAAILATPGNKIATDVSGNVTLTSSGQAALVTAIAAAILATPGNKIATDVSGNVTLTSSGQTALAVAIEAALRNDGDGQAFLASIQTAVQSLFDAGSDVPVATLVSQIAAAILVTPGNKLATNASGYVTATNGGSTDVTAITSALVAIQAAVELLAAAPANTDPTATENRLNFVIGETSSRTIALAYSYSGAVKVRWNTPRGVLIEEQSQTAAGATISAAPPALAVASPRIATWQVVRNDTKAELASGTYSVSAD